MYFSQLLRKVSKLGIGLAVIVTLTLDGCGGGGSSSSTAPPANAPPANASPIGSWVGSYQRADGSIHNLKLDFSATFFVTQWLDGVGSGMGSAYLLNGNTLTWVNNSSWWPFICTFTDARGQNWLYGSDQASATISGNSMTVIYTSSSSHPCSASGTVTLTKL